LQMACKTKDCDAVLYLLNKGYTVHDPKNTFSSCLDLLKTCPDETVLDPVKTNHITTALTWSKMWTPSLCRDLSAMIATSSLCINCSDKPTAFTFLLVLSRLEPQQEEGGSASGGAAVSYQVTGGDGQTLLPVLSPEMKQLILQIAFTSHHNPQ